LPLTDFSKTINVRVEEMPVHGDPILDNADLPIQIRILRKRIFDRVRTGELSDRGQILSEEAGKSISDRILANGRG
jgi:hypothetical protein